MAIFVRRGREALPGGPGEVPQPSVPPADQTVLELGDNDSVEVTVSGPSDPLPEPATESLRVRAAQLWPPRAQYVRLVALTVVILLAAVISVGVVQRSRTPTIDQLRHEAGWADLQSLNIGVTGDVPGVSDCPTAERCTGFDVEIALLVAHWLGVPTADVHFDKVLPKDRERLEGTDFDTLKTVDLDMVVAAFSITPERVNTDKAVFAGPYLSTQTTVLTRVDHPALESLEALDTPLVQKDGRSRIQRVCTPGTSTSAGYLATAVHRATIVPLQAESECVHLLLAGQVDAVVTDAALLAGFQAEYPRQLRLNSIASTVNENWGIGLGLDPTHDPRILARQQLVLLALQDLRTEPRDAGWYKAFDLLPQTGTPAGGTDVQVVADDRQPLLEGLKKVRRWPWEHSGTGSGR